MFRILFLPLLNIPSGHHHVADVMKRQLETCETEIQCEKVDLLSFSYGKLENLVSSAYLYWIHRFPNLYSSLYKFAAIKERKAEHRFFAYELFFLAKMKQLIDEAKPDAIICTHAFPSYLLSRLKQMRIWDGMAINVYTDYFVNSLWGMKWIDYHFAPSVHVKNHLASTGIKESQIYITGIPIDPVFQTQRENRDTKEKLTVLVSGGNMGAGSIRRFIFMLQPSGNIQYKVLCGTNEKLFQYVKQHNDPYIEPLTYITSKEEMNRLYEEADAIITKPGGVTISECIAKDLPIFVYDALPGQEEQNLRFLKEECLVQELSNWDRGINPEKEMLRVLKSDIKDHQSKKEQYKQQIELTDPHSFIIHHLKKLKRA